MNKFKVKDRVIYTAPTDGWTAEGVITKIVDGSAIIEVEPPRRYQKEAIYVPLKYCKAKPRRIVRAKRVKARIGDAKNEGAFPKLPVPRR